MDRAWDRQRPWASHCRSSMVIPAHALRQTALHLAAVHGGIDGAAEVVDDLHLVDGIGAAQAVDGDLEHGGAVHVVGERVAALALLVVVDARCDVVAVRGEAPARSVGEADQVGPVHARGLARPRTPARRRR